MSSHNGGARRGRSGGSAGGGSAPPSLTYASDRVREQMAARLGGRSVAAADVAGLLGAQSGDRVQVSNVFQVSVTGPHDAYSSTHAIQPAPDGSTGVINFAYTRADGRPIEATSPIFLNSLRAQVEAADKVGGVSVLTMKVRNGTTDNISLIRAGYDAPMSRVSHETWTRARTGLADPRVVSVHSVSELIATAAGARLWRREAMNPDLTFDLNRGSPSRQRLDAALRARGLQGLSVV